MNLPKLAAACYLAMAGVCGLQATPAATVSTVAVGGGGYVTGLIIHPKNPNLMYARTDVGGAYRWDAVAGAWVALTDWIPVGNVNLYGVESLAVDPNDTNTVYIAVGKNLGSSPHGIYKSTNRGATWSSLYLSNVRMSANDNITGGRASPFLRDAGERLAVDPNQSSILYFGSRSDGLWKSVNSGVSWSLVTIPNEGADGYGVSFVSFDPLSGAPGTASSNIFIGVFGTSTGGTNGGVFRSGDFGATWTLLANPGSGNVNQPRRGQCSPVDGTLWVTHQGGVAKAARTATVLTDATPAQDVNGYNGLALDPGSALKAVVVRGEVSSAARYRTINGGSSWSSISSGTHNSSVPWWTSGMFSAHVSGCAINPSQPNQLWFADWYGVWKTDDYTAGSPTWHNYEQGHEELVVFTLSCPPSPSVADLLNGCADVEGFRHTNLSAFPPFTFGNAPGNGSGTDFQSTFGLDYCENNPSFIVRGSGSDSGGAMGMCKSMDNGKSWTACSGWSSANEPRRVAVSASSTNVFLTILSGGKPMYTTNGGAAFATSGGVAENGPAGPWETAQPLAADRVDGTRFYYYISGKLYLSTDSGQTFTAVNTALANNSPQLKAMPGIKGRLILGLEGSGLWKSSNSGTNFTELKSPKGTSINARALGLGQPASGTNAWIYVYGTIDGVVGLFVSQDVGASWTAIDTGGNQMGCGPNIVEGSRQVVGRVYVGTSGRGVFCVNLLPPAPTGLVATAGNKRVSLSWSAVAGATSYNLKRSTASGGEITITNVVTTNCVDGNLTSGTTWFYEVSALNAFGEGANSSEVSATVNLPPTCLITNPAPGTAYPAFANITIWAAASDSNGNVTNVEFQINGAKVAEDTSAPYSFVTNSVSPGAYNLMAVATDNQGAATTSSVVSITVLMPLLLTGYQDGKLVLNWQGACVLQSKPVLDNNPATWVDVPDAVSPYTVPLLPQGSQFYRLRGP